MSPAFVRTATQLEIKVVGTQARTLKVFPDHDQTVLVDSCDDCAE